MHQPKHDRPPLPEPKKCAENLATASDLIKIEQCNMLVTYDVGIVLEFIDHILNHLFDHLCRAVALPVSTDEVLSCSLLRHRHFIRFNFIYPL